MSRYTEEQQDNTEQSRCRKHFRQKKHGAAALAISAVALFVIPVLAWFYFQKSLQTVTKINEPNPLVIGAGDARDITQLELSNIDVSEGTYRDVVFCVYSSKEDIQYHLQLAHTTNIGFAYTIYPADKAGNADVSGQQNQASVDYLGKTYYFNPQAPVAGKYLNQAEGSSAYAEQTGQYHDKTYPISGGGEGSYSYVQKNAEPLYWKTDTPLSLLSQDDTGHFINYYVLRISWENTVQNNKETDMIYLMAEAATDLSSDTMP